MNYDEMIKIAKDYAEKNYLHKENLSQDEELQLLSCGYTILFLSACAQKSTAELSHANNFIAECFEKIGDKNYSAKHKNLAESYFNIKK